MSKNNPWSELSQNPPYVLPYDKSAIALFNNSLKADDDDYRIRTELPPLPFQGRRDAPIVVLGLNPGYAKSDARNHLTPEFLATNWRNYAHEPADYPFFFLDPQYRGDAGQQWWHRRLSHLRESSKHQGIFTDKKLSESILSVQYFPYRSRYYRKMPNLDSQHYSFELVRSAIARKALIILLRSRKLWLGAVKELDQHEQCGRLLEVSNPRNPVLSKNQLGADGWARLIETIRTGSPCPNF